MLDTCNPSEHWNEVRGRASLPVHQEVTPGWVKSSSGSVADAFRENFYLRLLLNAQSGLMSAVAGSSRQIDSIEHLSHRSVTKIQTWSLALCLKILSSNWQTQCAFVLHIPLFTLPLSILSYSSRQNTSETLLVQKANHRVHEKQKTFISKLYFREGEKIE
jgi:hypothetical protein